MGTKTAPLVALPAPRLSTSLDEAMFPDEWGQRIERGLHENLYAGASFNGRVEATNPLFDPTLAIEPDLSPTEMARLAALVKRTQQNGSAQSPPPPELPLEDYWIFKPPSFGAAENVKVTLLFNPTSGTYSRHGLRKYFDGFADRVLINIPGIEKAWDNARTVGKAWGNGITATIIDQLFAQVGLGDVPWQVDVVGCYSTGFRGFNATINNFASQPALLDLSKVTMAIIYDAFYIGDEHPPSNCTWRAINALNDVTGGVVKVAAYDVTGGGTPKAAIHRKLHADLGNLLDVRFEMVNLSRLTGAVYGLIFARMLEAAIADGYFTARVLPTPMQNLIAALEPRGSFASPMAPTFRTPPASKKPFETWARDNAADVAAVTDAMREDLRVSRISSDLYNLMGWGPGRVDSILHDGFIPDFGWELLTG